MMLLPRHKLEFSWSDSGCSAKEALPALAKLLRGAHRIYAVLGPACSSACEVSFCVIFFRGMQLRVLIYR